MGKDLSKWTTVVTRLVEPDIKREPEWIEWSTLDEFSDRFAGHSFTSYFFLYKPEAGAVAEALRWRCVTDFQCGTRCLSTSWNHGVADGFSATHFLESWAKISRGEPISLMPVHDRTLLTPRKSSSVLDGSQVRFLNTSIKDPITVELAIPEEGVGTKVMKLSKRRINELKAEALSSHGGINLSRADCVSAHFWRLITEKRNLQGHELTRFVTVVNGRSRLKNFPAGYFGNCVTFAVVVMTAGELLSKPLGHAAVAIHNAVKAMDEEVIRGTIDWMAVNKLHSSCVGDEPSMPGDPNSNLHNSQVSWQNRFPFYELDFGGGRPSAVLRNRLKTRAFAGSRFYALPTTTSSEGDLKVLLIVENSLLKKLEDEI
ncbi:hypothetical protein R1sor_023484 [Riccia sorocarpa]|uniref:Uncharacterized protein n=1 Tax=Riccia sorocarpa TaxID=122646 RepID=A0ABD3GNJ6_9MARC